MSNAINVAELGKVAVLMGGQSAERDVSLNSGSAVLQALTSQKVDAHGIDVGADILSVLQKGKFDRVFIALHGRGGEDGTIQGALQTLGIPYTGSGVMASALAMDKLRTKQIWYALDYPTPAFALISSKEELEVKVKELGFPMMIKPSQEGSSIGIAKVNSIEELKTAYQTARQYDDEVLAEAWVTGEEYTATILGEEALPLIRLETPHEIYDYEAKYKVDTTLYHCPCGLDEEVENEFKELAFKAFKAVGAKGWGRVDLFRDTDGRPWLIEVNTVPGLTDHSLVPMSAKQAGISFEQLVIKILQQTL